MNKLTYSKLSTLSEYLQSHQEKSSLSLKIKFNANKLQNLQIIKVIEEELGKLTLLTDLALHISKQSILTFKGYSILSNTVLNLNLLKKLSIKIENECCLENEGLAILQDMINHLQQLIYLKLEINERNYITAEASQKFLDSLIKNTKLTTLSLKFEDVQSSTTNEGSLHFWRGIQNLKNLEKLRITLSTHNYSSLDLIELFEHIANLKKLSSLHLIFSQFSNYLQDPCLLEDLFPQIGKMIELRSLKIDYGLDKNILSEAQRRIILRNLSNLKSLEKFKLYALEQVLFNYSFGEYFNFIKANKSIKWDIKKNKMNMFPDQLISIGQSLLQLKNLINLELTLTLESGELTQFLQDLSTSFNSMNNLLSLVLEFKCHINSGGCSILGGSFEHLKILEKLELKLQEKISRVKVNKSGLLQGIRNLSNLKDLQIEMKSYQLVYEEDQIMFDSIIQLNKLERLDIKISLRNSLMNLRKLKYLKCPITICIQDSRGNELGVLENSIENLLDLEYLQLDICYFGSYNILQKASLVNHLTNLKTIVINFSTNIFNIFGSSPPSLLHLENCSFIFKYQFNVQSFLMLLESLSKSTVRKLNLKIMPQQSTDFSEYKEQFGIVFSKLSSVEKLIIWEESSCNLLSFLHGIQQLKSLSSLNLEYKENNLTKLDYQVLNLSLKQLCNLQKLKITWPYGKIIMIGDERGIQQFEQLASFEKLKHFQFEFDHQLQGKGCMRNIKVNQVCSLDLQQLNNNPMSSIDFENTQTLEVMQTINKNQLEQPQLSLGYQFQCEDSFLVSQVLNPTKIKIYIHNDDYEQSTFKFNQFDFLHSAYLNEFDVHCTLYCESCSDPLVLEITQPLRDLTSVSKLLRLKLYLQNVTFNEEQINYLSRNFQFLTNLQQLSFHTDNFQNYYHNLFDSFKYLVNLQDLSVSDCISENAAILLGHSIQSMRKLQLCQFSFYGDNNLFGQQGISTIFSGLNQTKKLKHLDLDFTTEQIIEEDNEICISECLSNQKLLQYLSLSFEINHINSSIFRQCFIQIGSLVSLNTLVLQIYSENPLNQDMLDELIKSMNKLENLNSFSIQIDIGNNPQISLPKDFATLFNMNPNSQLTISSSSDNSVLFEQSEKKVSIQLESWESLQVNFLEYLNESIKLILKIDENKILQKIKTCAATKIELRFWNLSSKHDIDSLCEFMSKIPKSLELEITVILDNLDRDLDREETIMAIAKSLKELKTTKILSLLLLDKQKNDIRDIGSNDLMIILNELKQMKQLQELSFKTSSESANTQIITKIIRAILRLVKLDFARQRSRIFY